MSLVTIENVFVSSEAGFSEVNPIGLSNLQVFVERVSLVSQLRRKSPTVSLFGVLRLAPAAISVSWPLWKRRSRPESALFLRQKPGGKENRRGIGCAGRRAYLRLPPLAQ
ncbi:hypothetical protein CEXT_362171 [Caerostris extrusa]|uniref:Uncharacterized protein n=1 Tax=Caerostris extrusa TaxID=172846 RepID=A0AAV4P784_CAEEX|nr:hypothetical protein CEXT_362171 [Caerostris extrusa]